MAARCMKAGAVRYVLITLPSSTFSCCTLISYSFQANFKIELCCPRWVDDGLDLRNPIGREAAFLRVPLDQVGTRSRVHAIDLVIGHITVYPLNLISDTVEHAARLG